MAQSLLAIVTYNGEQMKVVDVINVINALPGTETVTSAVRGIFQSSAATRAEAMSLITDRSRR